MISSCMFSVTPPAAKARHTTGIARISFPLSTRTSQAMPRRSAPVASNTANAPPMRKIRNTTSARCAIPRGIATMASNAPMRFASTS